MTQSPAENDTGHEDRLADKASTSARDIKETVRAEAGDAANKVKNELEGAAESVRDRAAEEADRGKDYAADQVDAVASAIRRSARQYEGEVGAETVSRYAENAADRFTQFGETLRKKDLRSIVSDAESFARSHPALVFGMAFAGGLLAARFLRASADGPNNRELAYQADNRAPQGDGMYARNHDGDLYARTPTVREQNTEPALGTVGGTRHG